MERRGGFGGASLEVNEAEWHRSAEMHWDLEIWPFIARKHTEWMVYRYPENVTRAKMAEFQRNETTSSSEGNDFFDERKNYQFLFNLWSNSLSVIIIIDHPIRGNLLALERSRCKSPKKARAHQIIIISCLFEPLVVANLLCGWDSFECSSVLSARCNSIKARLAAFKAIFSFRFGIIVEIERGCPSYLHANRSFYHRRIHFPRLRYVLPYIFHFLPALRHILLSFFPLFVDRRQRAQPSK